MPNYTTPREWIENVPAEEWPTRQVTCPTEGCINNGEVHTIPDIGQNAICGVCNAELVPAGRG